MTSFGAPPKVTLQPRRGFMARDSHLIQTASILINFLRMMHIMKSTATILSCIALWLYTAGAGAAANVKDPNAGWVIICGSGQAQVVSDGSCVSACPKGINFTPGAIWPNRGGPSCIDPLNPPPPRPAATNARSPDPELSEAKSQLVKCLDKAPNNVVNTNSGQFVAYCLRQLGW